MFIKGFSNNVLGNSLAPNRILNAISVRSSRRLRNSLCSDILAARLRRVPSKSELRWLNPQWSLRQFPKTSTLNMETCYQKSGIK
jgi:hypothetical protein